MLFRSTMVGLQSAHNVFFQLALISHYLIGCTVALCYYPNQKLADHLACNPNQENSVCCPENWPCLSNNFCLDPKHSNATTYPDNSTYIRASCTDQTWRSPECPSRCLTENQGTAIEVAMFCGDGKYCCYSFNCCKDDSSDKYDLADPVISTTAQLASATPTSSSTASASSLPSPSTTSVPPSETDPKAAPTQTADPKKSSNSAAIGAGVGVPVIILAVAGVIAGIWWFRKKKSRRAPKGEITALGELDGQQHQEDAKRWHGAQLEMDARQDPPVYHQLETTERPAELA